MQFQPFEIFGMGLAVFGLIAMRTKKLQIIEIIRPAPRKRDNVVNLIDKEQPVAMRVQPQVGTSIALGQPQLLNIASSKGSIGLLFSGPTAFNSGPAFIWILMAPIARLLVDCFSIICSHLSLIGSMTDFAKTCFSIMPRCVIEELREGLSLLTHPALFLSRFLKLFFLLPVLNGIRISNFLSASPTTRGITVFMTCVFVKFRQWFEDIASTAQFHLASVRKSVFDDWGRQGTDGPAFRFVNLALT